MLCRFTFDDLHLKKDVRTNIFNKEIELSWDISVFSQVKTFSELVKNIIKTNQKLPNWHKKLNKLTFRSSIY